MGTGNFFGWGKEGHKVRDFPKFRSQDKGKSFKYRCYKRNQFYVLPSRGEEEESLDVVTNTLQRFSIDVYALPDPNST